jgi:hypothetical protein
MIALKNSVQCTFFNLFCSFSLNIFSANVCIVRRGSKPRFGFVQFENEEDAVSVLNWGYDIELDGRILKVDWERN